MANGVARQLWGRFSSEQRTEQTKAATGEAEPRGNSNPINGPGMPCAKPDQRGSSVIFEILAVTLVNSEQVRCSIL